MRERLCWAMEGIVFLAVVYICWGGIGLVHGIWSLLFTHTLDQMREKTKTVQP